MRVSVAILCFHSPFCLTVIGFNTDLIYATSVLLPSSTYLSLKDLSFSFSSLMSNGKKKIDLPFSLKILQCTSRCIEHYDFTASRLFIDDPAGYTQRPYIELVEGDVASALYSEEETVSTYTLEHPLVNVAISWSAILRPAPLPKLIETGFDSVPYNPSRVSQ